MWISDFSIFDLLAALPAHPPEATKPTKVELWGRNSAPQPAGALSGLYGRHVMRMGRRVWPMGATRAQYHMACPGRPVGWPCRPVGASSVGEATQVEIVLSEWW